MAATVTLADLDALAATALVPLRARAEDAASPSPILGDRAAADLAQRLDAVMPGGSVDASTRAGCCIRGKVIDTWLAALAERLGQPLGAVIDLGVGLNTRAERLPSLARRYLEVDAPSIIDLRRRWLPNDQVIRVAGDALRVENWIGDALPADGPVAVVCEALLAYQRPAAVGDFLDALGCVLPGAYLLFDSLSPLAARLANRPPALAGGRPPYVWTTNRTRSLRANGRRMEVLAEVSLLDQPTACTRQFPAGQRLLFSLPGLRRAFRLTHARLPGATA
ncbi:tetracenomycin C synthesis protein [Pilimelia terevasa]|uniref:Tetracenomycin C synthesis protein n=1 Tax=Pilimelia terevasa TaxID=53372 RepID=A0A8J3BNP4_9ACTN|nr:class I SAM-dependent methyltransferase [Pilimelia terevasa]GGK34736.1 tetracenomycin C synthesis protein [Pilimelia terevasa]